MKQDTRKSGVVFFHEENLVRSLTAPVDTDRGEMMACTDVKTGEASIYPFDELIPYTGPAESLMVFAKATKRQEEAQRKRSAEIHSMETILKLFPCVWVSTELLAEKLGVTKRDLRDRAEHSEGRISSRTHNGGGYAFTERLTKEEAHRCASRLSSQARQMELRSMKVLKVWYGSERKKIKASGCQGTLF